MRAVHILGAGGIGVALGAFLARAGWDVTLVDVNAAKIEAGRREGMSLDGAPGIHAGFSHFREWTAPAGTLLLLCTKTFDNPAVLARIPDRRRLIPIQNGFDPELDASPHPLEGIASFVSQCELHRPATRLTRAGDLHLGGRRPLTPEDHAQLGVLADGIRQGGFSRVQVVPAILPYKLSKLMYNSAISPLAAAAGLDNAGLLREPLARRLFFSLLRENYGILRRSGARLARVGPFHPRVVDAILRVPGLAPLFARYFRPSLEGTYCSMAPDLGTGRTETGAYNGHLLRLAQASGAPAPINAAVLRMMDTIEAEHLPAAPARLEELSLALKAGSP